MSHYVQGPNDGLCGFYAALNGLSFLLGPQAWYRREHPDYKTDTDPEQTRFDEAILALACVKGVSLRNVRGRTGLRGKKLEELLNILSERWNLNSEIKHYESEDGLGVRNLFSDAEALGRRVGMIAAIEGDKHWVAVVRRGGKLVAIDCRRGREHPKFIQSPRLYDKEAITFDLLSDAAD